MQQLTDTLMETNATVVRQSFSVKFAYDVYFTTHLFDGKNTLLKDFLHQRKTDTVKKIFFVVDEGVMNHHEYLDKQIRSYFANETSISLVEEIMVVPGGETAKNTERLLLNIVDAVDKYGIDRHSYIVAIGGGAVLDLVGYAAAISHRGIRHIRIPTTVLSQDDSAIGVKNGVNYKGKKNFLGTFAPPVAVFNDFYFLTTLTDAEWRSGISEAVKVALIKDAPFFAWLKENATVLANRNMEAMRYLVQRSAALHMEHIAGGDPFEMGSSRPLDFGHWSAHKLEQLSGFTVKHGEAVALGIALDSAYSFVSGRLSEDDAKSIVEVLLNLGFSISHPLMDIKDKTSPVIKGLEEFREHLGGKLTIMLLAAIGQGEEVHELDITLLQKASAWLGTI